MQPTSTFPFVLPPCERSLQTEVELPAPASPRIRKEYSYPESLALGARLADLEPPNGSRYVFVRRAPRNRTFHLAQQQAKPRLLFLLLFENNERRSDNVVLDCEKRCPSDISI